MRRAINTATTILLLAAGGTALGWVTLTHPHVMAWVWGIPALAAAVLGLVAWGYSMGARDERDDAERAMRGMRLQVEAALAELQALVNDDFTAWEHEIREVS